MKLLLLFTITLIFISNNLYSQNINSQNNKLRLGLGATYGFDRFDENEIRETADNYGLVQYSSPVYEHENTLGSTAFGEYQFLNLFLAKLEVSYLVGFKSNYTIYDILLDYEKAYFRSDLLSIILSPGIVLNINRKSNFYLYTGIGILHRKLDIYQEVSVNRLVTTNINKKTENATALMAAFHAQYSYIFYKDTDLFFEAKYNIGFGDLSRSNFISFSAGITYSL